MGALLSPLGPAPEVPDRNLVSSWSAASMQGYLDALDRARLHAVASRAVDLEAAGAEHFDVVMALAAAEGIAAKLSAEELSFHAARLDAYATAHQLRGWYRYTDFHGEHRVQVNLIRTAADGNVGRYYVHHVPLTPAEEKPYWVVDRDSGCVAARRSTTEEAQAWVAAAGGVPAARVETIAVAGAVL